MKTDITIDQASEVVRKNLELWDTKWHERCSLFKEFAEGTYSKHILAILPDLIDEVEHNEKRFSENNFAKYFFSSVLSRYCIARKTSTTKTISLNCSQQFALEIQSELGFVLEALLANQSSSHSFVIAHLLPCLTRIDNILRTNESCRHATRLLLEFLCKEEEIASDNLEIIELCDTLIFLFWRKGTLPESIEWFAGNILSGIQKLDNGIVNSSYPNCPKKENLSSEEYERILSTYLSRITLEERFSEIIKLYSREPREYEIIFKVNGFEHETSGFSIGSITVYDPRKENHIKKALVDGAALDFAGVERVEGNQLSISVRIRGTDISSMKLQARKKAERSLGLISRQKTGQKALILSNAYAVCDSEGREIAGSSEGGQSGVYHPIGLVKWKKREYERFGTWINSESNNQSIRIWLASMDWYRKAIECKESSEMLLNAWFSIEHLFQGKSKVSLRLPGFLRSRPNEKQTDTLMYPKDQLAQIQLILGLMEVKHELIKYAGEVANMFIPSSNIFFKLKYHKDFVLTNDVLAKFIEKDGLTYTGGGFVAVSDVVIDQLKEKNIIEALHEVELIRELFFNNLFAKNKLRSEIWRIKDDIYNIYRIRNMLVHRATTGSVMVEYYATRALEYSFSLLTELKWTLLQTNDDSEIGNINEYFQEWILEGNIGLEAVQSGDMYKFRKWVFG